MMLYRTVFIPILSNQYLTVKMFLHCDDDLIVYHVARSSRDGLHTQLCKMISKSGRSPACLDAIARYKFGRLCREQTSISDCCRAFHSYWNIANRMERTFAGLS